MTDTRNYNIPDWAYGCNLAITVCDKECRIIYMNQRSKDTFSNGDDSLVGTSLRVCHPPRALAIIDRLLSKGGTNAYTIHKKGVKKLIFQTSWTMPDGTIGGLTELSMVLPEDLPHYDRG